MVKSSLHNAIGKILSLRSLQVSSLATTSIQSLSTISGTNLICTISQITKQY